VDWFQCEEGIGKNSKGHAPRLWRGLETAPQPATMQCVIGPAEALIWSASPPRPRQQEAAHEFQVAAAELLRLAPASS